MRQNAERRAAAVERAGAEDDIAMLDDDDSDDPAPLDDEEDRFSGHPSEMPALSGVQPPTTREELRRLGMPAPAGGGSDGGSDGGFDGGSDAEMEGADFEPEFAQAEYFELQAQRAQHAQHAGPSRSSRSQPEARC